MQLTIDSVADRTWISYGKPTNVNVNSRMKLRKVSMHLLVLIIWYTAYLFFLVGMFTRGNTNGRRSFAMLWLLVSALVNLNLVMSVCVGGATLQPSSWKYCLILWRSQSPVVEIWRREIILLVFNLQILTQVIDIHFKVVYDECCCCDMCHEVIDVPARHIVVSRRISRMTKEIDWAHTLTQISS